MTTTETGPTFIALADGAWLAVAAPDSVFRVGGWGATQEAARESLLQAFERIDEALQRV